MKTKGNPLLELFEAAMNGTRNPLGGSPFIEALLDESALSRGINRNAHLTEATRGVETALEAMRALTKYCVELTESNSTSELNKLYRADELTVGNHSSIFSRAVGILLESYNIEWLDAYLRMVSIRLALGEETYADRLLVKEIHTLIMKGAIAVPVVQVLEIPIKEWALYGVAAIHLLSRELSVYEPDTFNGERTIQSFLESRTQEGVRSVLLNEREAVVELYTYITQGDLHQAVHHVRILEKAYGIVSPPEEDFPDIIDGDRDKSSTLSR